MTGDLTRQQQIIGEMIDNDERVAVYMTEAGLIPQPFWDALNAADLIIDKVADDGPCELENCRECASLFGAVAAYRTARRKLHTR